MRYALTMALLIVLLLAGCSSGGASDVGTGAAAETPSAATGATDTMTDTAGADDTAATDTMTDTADTGDAGATDAMTDTAGTGDAGATDAMTGTAGTSDAGATDAMTDTAGTDDTAAEGGADAAGAVQGSAAHAEMMAADGTVVGMAHFTDSADGGVMVQVDVQGVAGAAAGEHGIHVHMVGACDAPDFMSAGEHFNPTAMKHGLENPDGPHAGDMPNISLDDAGSGAYSTTTTMFTVGDGDTSLMDADGSAIIIHANPDDQVTDPSGNSGDRIVCGVIMADAAAQ